MKRNPLLRPALAAQPKLALPLIAVWWVLRVLIILRYRTYVMQIYPLLAILVFLSFGSTNLPAKTCVMLFIWWLCWVWPTLFTDNASKYQFDYELPEAPGMRRWRVHYDQLLLSAAEGLYDAKGEYYLLDCGHAAPIYRQSRLEMGNARPCSLHREYPRFSTVIGMSFDPSKDYQLVPSSRH